jgi:hypothetical protein
MTGSTLDPEDRERLERFLQWRQRTGRARPTRRPTKTYLAYAATAVLAGVGLAVSLWIALSTDARQRVASTRPVPSAPAETPATDRARREPVAAKSPERPAPLAAQSPTAVAPSLPPAPARDVARVPSSVPPLLPRGIPPQRRAAPAQDVRSVPPPLPPAPLRDFASAPPASSAPSLNVPGAPPPLPPARPEHVTRASVPPPGAAQTPEASAPVRPVHVVPATDSGSRAVAQAPTASPETPSALGKHIETLKHLAGYLPEVRIARVIAAWVKTQPAPDGEPRPEPPSVQTR